jgi:hypothetical protein
MAVQKEINIVKIGRVVLESEDGVRASRISVRARSPSAMLRAGSHPAELRGVRDGRIVKACAA